jgi:transposase
MWKPEHRLAADRRDLRYPSDLTDAEWTIVAAMIPPGRRGGRRQSVNGREVQDSRRELGNLWSTSGSWHTAPLIRG